MGIAGFTGEGSTVWIWLNGIVASVWWIIKLWMTILIVGSVLWTGLLYGAHVLKKRLELQLI
jgi:hypothetical protein